MGYLGLTPTTAQQNYLNIDDISGSFNGSTTSFALLTGGVAPSPFPVTNSCLISVGGVIQEPDDTGTSGFRISGSNIVFSSAPGTGEDFFGLILAGADYLNIGANFPAGTVGSPSITFDGDTNTGIYRPSADEIGLVTGGSEAIRIDSNSRVGIGTVSASTKLDVSDNTAAPLRLTRNQAISSGVGLIIRQPNTTDGNDLRISYLSDTTGAGAASDVDFAAIEFTAATHDNSTRAGEIGFYTAQGGTGFVKRMLINSTGHVGINTSAIPSGLINLTVDRAGGPGSIQLAYNNTGGGAIVPASAGGLEFYTYTGATGSETYTERFRVTSNGSIAIGSVSISATTQSDGATVLSPVVEIKGTNAGATNATGAIRLQRQDGTAGAFIYSSGNDGGLNLRTVDANGITFRNSAGSALGFWRNAGGLCFNADTAADNALDDYEEGTWTPVWSSSGAAGPGVSDIINGYQFRNGRYTKIGRKVFFEMYIRSTSSGIAYQNGGAGSQSLYIGGLPFTASNSSTFPSISVGYFDQWVGWTSGYTPMGYVNNNAVWIELTYAVGNGSTPILTNNIFNNSSAILLAGSYTI